MARWLCVKLIITMSAHMTRSELARYSTADLGPVHVASSRSALRVSLQQPALPKYRVPVFRELARRPGISIKVVYGDLPGLSNVDPDGFEATYARPRRWHLLGETMIWQPAQWQSATRAEADVLILPWDVHYASLMPALLRARRHGVPTILWGHGYSKHERPWRKMARDGVARLATALLFYNHRAAGAQIAHGFPAERIFVAPNAIDQRPVQEARGWWLANPHRLEEFRQQAGLTRGPVVLFVSRLDPDNRVDLLIRAAARLVRDFEHLRVIIVGSGPDGQRLKELSASLGLKHSVLFPGAIYDEQALAPWFLCADVFCYPANIGLSLLHAFGYGLPVVTSDRIDAQNPEIEAMADGQNGLFYSHGDEDSLCRKLRMLFEDRCLRLRLSTEALRTATHRYTLEKMVDGMEAAIRYAAATVRRWDRCAGSSARHRR